MFIKMGRRARTNCSPIDSAMEKYHNDIGSRLSGVFVPTQPCLDNSGANSSADDGVCMLTLDMRSSKTQSHINDNNNNNNSNAVTTVLNSSSQHHQSSHPTTISTKRYHNDRDCSPAITATIAPCQQSEKSQTLPAFTNPSQALTMDNKAQESHSFTEDVKEKRGLVDKLTRALFQRKHMCTRCQRKSKSCLPNKNFNSTEKHYMCGRCRETNSTMKCLVSGKSIPVNSIPLNNPNTELDDVIVLSKPRTHLKDSGYETVTSCSTVASSHSHNSTINGSSRKPCLFIQNGCLVDNHATTPCSDNSTSNPNSNQYTEQLNTHCYVGQSCCNPTVTLQQYMGVTGENSTVPILKQVRARNVEDYDGYLPSNQTTQACVVKRPTLPTSGAPTSTEEGVDSTCNAIIDNTFHSSDQECLHTTGCINSKPSTKKNIKVCYTCGSTTKPCFHLPWEGGWLCEDCLDGVF